MIRNHGMAKRDEQDILGFNFRMTDIHAAIGLEQLKKLEGFNRSRRANAHYLIHNLQGVVVPFVPRDCQHVFNQFTVRILDGRRDELKQHLSDRGIGSMIYYPLPVYRQSYYIEQQGYDLHLPNAERAAAEVLSLPVHPGLNEGDLKKIVSSVNSFFTKDVL
jgi:dTDP-4-amino-4,6-dideoxygalactose transaminase